MKVVEVWTDDWCAVYINGKLVQEGHSINFHDFMYTLVSMGLIESYDSKEVYTEDNYPEQLSDLKLD